jgi:hypothetical protein
VGSSKPLRGGLCCWCGGVRWDLTLVAHFTKLMTMVLPLLVKTAEIFRWKPMSAFSVSILDCLLSA